MKTAKPRYQNVLASTDASERGAYVLRVAAALVHRWSVGGTALRMVHVPADLPTSHFNLRPHEIEAALKGRSEYELGSTLKEMSLEWPVKVVVGIPWDGICRTAAEIEQPLTVIGSHGYQLLDRFLGTTAARVVNHISSSVLVARATPEIERGVKHVLVGLDDSTRAAAVLEAAVEFAQTFGADKPAQLTAVRVVHVPEFPGEAVGPEKSLAQTLMDRAAAELEHLLRDVPPELKAKSDLRHGRPWRALLAAAEDTKPDLIVIGSHGYDTVDHLIGTNAARVADRAPCSVLVVK